MTGIQFLEVLKICMEWYDVETISHCARVVKNLEKDIRMMLLQNSQKKLTNIVGVGVNNGYHDFFR